MIFAERSSKRQSVFLHRKMTAVTFQGQLYFIILDGKVTRSVAMRWEQLTILQNLLWSEPYSEK